MICRLVQFALGWRPESATTPPRWCRRHLDRCEFCRAAVASEHALHQQLCAAGAGPQPAAPPGLAETVLAALRSGANPASAPPPPPEWAWFKPAVAAVALLGILTGAWWQFRPQGKPAGPYTNPVELVRSALPADWLLSNPEVWLERSARWQDPLQRELDRLLADTRAAARSLADTLAPTTMLARIAGSGSEPAPAP